MHYQYFVIELSRVTIQINIWTFNPHQSSSTKWRISCFEGTHPSASGAILSKKGGLCDLLGLLGPFLLVSWLFFNQFAWIFVFIFLKLGFLSAQNFAHTLWPTCLHFSRQCPLWPQLIFSPSSSTKKSSFTTQAPSWPTCHTPSVFVRSSKLTTCLWWNSLKTTGNNYTHIPIVWNLNSTMRSSSLQLIVLLVKKNQDLL